MALLQATSLNSAFLLPLLQVIRSASTGLLQVPRARTMIGQRQSHYCNWRGAASHNTFSSYTPD